MKKRIVSLLLFIAIIASALAAVSCDEKPNKDNDLKDDMYLKLVNKSNPAGEDYVPENLVPVDTAYTTGAKSIELEECVAKAVISMIDAMRAEGINNVSVTSAYRTYEYQEQLFARYIAEEKKKHPTWSDEEVRAEVLTYSAAPGTSEHQTGLCVDLFTIEMEGLYNYGSETPNNPYDKGFAETDAFEWLGEHAHEYGFILRFPEDKTEITGYSYESWHYRYVGVEHAKKIHEEGITLEEYLENGK